MAIRKRHHYLPESYLKPFTRDRFLWVYDRRQDQYRHEQPRNTTVRTHYYSLTDEQGNKDVRVEKVLSVVESLAKPIVKKLISGERLTPREHFRMSFHLGLLYCRGPRYQRAVNELITGHMRMLVLRNLIDPVASKYFRNPNSEAEYVRSERFKYETQPQRNNSGNAPASKGDRRRALSPQMAGRQSTNPRCRGKSLFLLLRARGEKRTRAH